MLIPERENEPCFNLSGRVLVRGRAALPSFDSAESRVNCPAMVLSLVKANFFRGQVAGYAAHLGIAGYRSTRALLLVVHL
ncbi:hypothetical protein H634G_03415 [Metarhizium anisopliae BRIP 53293]|uniref:Uncharacterized protein n=1 Tax=Metarhizium anisopliae BRIP 53293 TaxID=1291518 RepID=A0A0D9P9A7_METAN|nr:hypothetical protein H634G_03415 [Metarhizium anisopliae BRIP 53293]KJK84760.1 hypothetical protein H633G_11465 [Metarhizium anisopliae BRIP 53284]